MICCRDALKVGAAGLVTPSLGGVIPAKTLAAQTQSGSVPMFRGNVARTGEMPGPGPSLDKPIVVKWRHSTVDAVASSASSLAVVDGCVFIGSYDENENGNVYAIGNLEATILVADVTLRGGPSLSGVERGTAKADDVVSNVGAREERDGQIWAEVTIGDVTGWIPLDAIDPAILPPEGEIEYVYIPE